MRSRLVSPAYALLFLVLGVSCGGNAVSSGDDVDGVGGSALTGSGGANASGGQGSDDEGTGGGLAPSGTSSVEVCQQERDLVDLVWTDEDTRRFSCNVEAVGVSIWSLSFEDCVADAEACIADSEATAPPPAWDCEMLATDDATVSDAERSEAQALANKCFEEWQAFLDGVKASATCETLTENPLQIATTALTVSLIVSAPNLVQPASCREFSEKYGSRGGGGDWD